MLRVLALWILMAAVAASAGACTTTATDVPDADPPVAADSASNAAAGDEGYPGLDLNEPPDEGYPGEADSAETAGDQRDDSGSDEAAGGEDGDAPLAIAADQISLDTQGLATSWQAVVVEGTAYDESMPPGPMGLPTHIEILFGVTDPAEREPRGPIMYIIPVDSYRKLWSDAGNESVATSIAGIEDFAASLNTTPTQGVPALPSEEVNGYNDVAVQIGRVTPAGEMNIVSATQDGYRFVGRWALDANPVTNEGLRYVYQGFTNDGVYLVSFFWPVSTSELPDDASELSQEQWDEFYADTQAAVLSGGQTADALSADQWEPDLSTLDALVASLGIDGMISAGLLDTTWEWVSGPVTPGSSETITVTNPSAYQATYGSDDKLTLQADCNNGSLEFELTDTGNIGGMLADHAAAMTLVECGAGSLSQGFVSSLQAAQSYRVHAGGNDMDLVLPAGGGNLLLRAAE